MRPIEPFKEKEPQKDLEKARQEFIRKGGMVSSDVKKDTSKEWIKINLRITLNAMNKIDGIVSSKMGVTRTSWIQQAIEEKFLRDDNSIN